MNGKELAERVLALYPRMKVLFTSAYTETAVVHQEALSSGAALLQKPFTPAELARKVREVLAARNKGNGAGPGIAPETACAGNP